MFVLQSFTYRYGCFQVTVLRLELLCLRLYTGQFSLSLANYGEIMRMIGDIGNCLQNFFSTTVILGQFCQCCQFVWSKTQGDCFFISLKRFLKMGGLFLSVLQMFLCSADILVQHL
ncbi:hypothetical protein ES708_26944 [subsurface metagenome]